tara:strand:+ start:147 stop:323 length:177 start_codon:yes stop_codon:yes gene_type:complete
MNIRKVKKQVKKLDDWQLKGIALMSLRGIKKWAKINHRNNKSNMKILTGNFYRNGRFE